MISVAKRGAAGGTCLPAGWPIKEQSYLRRIAESENKNAELRQQVATLTEQNAELRQQVAKLAEQVARLSKNSSNSSKPPSSDIVKPPKGDNPGGPRRQGGQPGHKRVQHYRPRQRRPGGAL